MVEILNLALQTFKSHKMRSFLTILGIVIGVTTVIAILSLIEGLNQSVAQQIRSIGSDLIFVTKYPMIRMGMGNLEEIAKRPDLLPDDAIAIKQLPSVETAVPTIEQNFAKLKYKDKEVAMTSIKGSTEDFSRIHNYIVEMGRDLNADDIRHKRNVGVVGSYVVKNLYGDEAPIGKDLYIGVHRIKIIGIYKEKGSFLGQSQDNLIAIPYTFYEKIFPRKRTTIVERVFGSYVISVMPKPGKVEKAMDEIRELMRRRHGLRLDQQDDFELGTQQMLFEIYQNVTRVGFVAIIAIAAISLIVGGIGIMNIMLVSVAERTREIGIRKAVGASNQNILFQFITESVVLSLVGGIIGIILGIFLAWIISSVSPLKAAVAPWMIILGFGFSSVVGIFFGIYPARKAASLNPIEALRYE
ncbi:MAG: ABC transporter permease [bacterium]